ncbi:MAG: hypothetical protein KDB27_01050, partial [Planctomycetales bacterium]|nr:hypothetical protein [Planctomycetales bacterium]
DKLFHSELSKFLSESNDSYDIIAAADTLNYFGDLKDVFAATASALRDGGVFVFTLEKLDSDLTSENFEIGNHGRYAHAIEYVGLELQKAGFEVSSITTETVRTEATQPVVGYVVVATKSVGQ